MPEIFLAIIITFLLGYGVFFMVYTSESNFYKNKNSLISLKIPNFSSEFKTGKHSLFMHFNYLCLLVLFWTFILLICLNNHLTYISDVLFIDSFSSIGFVIFKNHFPKIF